MRPIDTAIVIVVLIAAVAGLLRGLVVLARHLNAAEDAKEAARKADAEAEAPPEAPPVRDPSLQELSAALARLDSLAVEAREQSRRASEFASQLSICEVLASRQLTREIEVGYGHLPDSFKSSAAEAVTALAKTAHSHRCMLRLREAQLALLTGKAPDEPVDDPRASVSAHVPGCDRPMTGPCECEAMSPEERAERTAKADNPLDRPLTTSCGHTWTLRHTSCPVCFDAIRSENADLRAKVAALREALAEQVDKCWTRSGVGIADHEADCDECRQARRALEETW